MKSMVVLLVLGLLCAPGLAFSPTELSELIESVGDDLVEQYAQPLAQSYGVAMGSGWYHSARSLRLLRIEIGARVMLVSIPEKARTFTTDILACSINTRELKLDTFRIRVDNVATIFGPRGKQSVNNPEHSLAFPPILPGGADLRTMPFAVPHAAIGLPLGLELSARVLPISIEGVSINLFGIGAKSELSSFVQLPIDLAAQAFYQQLDVGDYFSSRSFGGNVHASSSWLAFTPYAGFGFDKTSTEMNYTYRGRFPTGYDPQTNQITDEERDISITARHSPPANLRATAGMTAKLLVILLNADYSFNLTTGYHAASFGLGISLR